MLSYSYITLDITTLLPVEKATLLTVSHAGSAYRGFDISGEIFMTYPIPIFEEENFHETSRVVCKIFRSIIKVELSDLTNLFTAYQHGFWPGYSCVMQLINVMEDRT